MLVSPISFLYPVPSSRAFPAISSLHGYRAAVDWQIDARDEAAFVGRQEQNGRGNLFGPSNPLHWRHGDEPVLHRADVRAELGFEKRCFDRAWADHVGADALVRELSGPRADKRAQGRLSGAICRIHRNTFLPGAGAVDDDRTAVLHQRKGLLHRKENAAGIYAEGLVVVLG